MMNALNEKGKTLYPSLFVQYKVGPITLPNRIFFPPMSFNWANHDGTVSEKLHGFCIDLADGGCGMINVGPAAVSPDSRLYEYMLQLHNEEHVPTLKKLCDDISSRGSVPAIQLINFGRQSITTFTGKELYAPSPIPCPVNTKFDPDYKIREMTLEDIDRVKNDFAKSAALAVEAGVKVIQLQGGHGFLLNEFLSPYTNHRTDEYGGELENRIRFVVEVIEAVKNVVGHEAAIDIRLSADELIDKGLKPADYKEILPLLEKAGIDMITVSTGISYAFLRHPLEPQARYSHLAEELQGYCNVPVAHAGFIASIKKAERLLGNEKMGIVGLGRAQLADPYMVRKAAEGRDEDINKCLWDNQCLWRFANRGEMKTFCLVNQKYKRPNKVVNDYNFVDQKYVHKDQQENVHIYNVQRILPISFPSQVFEMDVLPVLDEAERKLITDNYILVKPEEYLDESKEAKPFYVLRTLRESFAAKEYEEVAEEELRPEDRDFLSNLYKKDTGLDKYIRTKNLADPDRFGFHLPDSERANISLILEKNKKISKSNVFFASLHVDPEHEYFFEHSNDHAPGMMLIETARQFLTACTHIYGGVPLTGINFILSALDVMFTDYVLMSHPCRIKGNVDVRFTNDDGAWTDLEARVGFYQAGNIKAWSRIEANMMRNMVLEKIYSQKHLKYTTRFEPIPEFNIEVNLRDVDDNSNNYFGNIMDISPKGFMLEFNDSIGLRKGNEFEFNINLEKSLYAHGRCSVQWYREKGGRHVAGLKITNIDPVNSENVYEVIKRLCHFRDQRETASGIYGVI
ncbi:MAG: hypothetical protein GY754_19395 [bacterium]|nr:hypothetical protein [bacterium]